MRRLRGKQGLLLGIVALALVAAACGNNASASTSGGTTTTPTPTPTPSPSYGGGGGSPSYGMPPSNAKTVVEGPGNSFAFMPPTITVTRGATLKLQNVSDTAHTFTVTGQGIDVETMPGKTAKVTIDLPLGTYPFVCRFHESMGMKGDLGGPILIDGARTTGSASCDSIVVIRLSSIGWGPVVCRSSRDEFGAWQGS